MKPIEKPQFNNMENTNTPKFDHLCETMSNMFTYYDALESLKNAATYVAESAVQILTNYNGEPYRVATSALLANLANLEINMAYFKRTGIHDIMTDYDLEKSQIIEKKLREYHITED